MPGYYTTFCESLYETLSKEVPIWVIGHAGHSEPKETETEMKIPKLSKDNSHLFDLNGQLKHKIEFIDLIPNQINKIYVIGHSVGARLILDLLKESPKFDQKVVKCYLMFPTIEKIANSAQGEIFTKLIPFFFLARLFLQFFNLFPLGFRRKVVKLFGGEMSDEFYDVTLECVKTEVLKKVFHMAADEMDKIREYDEELIRRNLPRLKLYYGQKDRWVRKRYYYDIVEKFPEIDAEMCNRNFEHAFVIKNGPEVGEMVGGWIKESIYSGD